MFAPKVRRVERPEAPNCPLHLQRICGTCAHFAGTLRQSARGECAKDHRWRLPRCSGANCPEWERKGAGA